MDAAMTTHALLFAMVAMALWGVAPVLGKLGLKGIDPLAALAIRSGAVTLALAAAVTVTGRWPQVLAAPPREAGLIVLEGLFAALLGQLAYYYALKYGEVGKVAPTVAAFPLVAVAVGLAVLGEKLTWGKALGALLIAAGVVLVNYR